MNLMWDNYWKDDVGGDAGQAMGVQRIWAPAPPQTASKSSQAPPGGVCFWALIAAPGCTPCWPTCTTSLTLSLLREHVSLW